MRKEEVPLLGAQLNALAEVYDKRAITPAAVQVWVDTLKEFPIEKSLSLLIDWPKSHSKFPTPAEIWKIINDRAIDDREAKQASENVRYERESMAFVSNLRGRQITGEILSKLNTEPKDPKGWAKKILDRNAQDPSSVSWLQLSYAREAMGLDVRTGLAPRREREPGDDDEEIAA